MTLTAFVQEKFGLPNLTGRKFFVWSTVLDSLVSGIIFAFLLLFFNEVTAVPLDKIGLAMTIGRFATLLSPVIAARGLDRYGPIPVVITGNFVSLIGVLVASIASNFTTILISQLLIQTGTNLYWTCSRSVVALAAQRDQLPRWFSLLGALRNAGTGIGAILAASLLQTHNALALRWFVAATGICFLLASAFLVDWQRTQKIPLAHVPGEEAESGVRQTIWSVLKEPTYRRLVLGNLCFVILAMALPLLYPLWIVETLQLPASVAGVIVAINTVLVAFFSTVVTSKTENFRTKTVIWAAGVCNVAAFVIMVPQIDSQTLGLIACLISVVAFTLAEILSTPRLSDLSVKLVKGAQEGPYQACFQLSWSVGMAISPLLFAALFSINPICAGTTCVVLALAGAWILPSSS